VPFAVVFCVLTVGIPVLYVYCGLKRKDKILLHAGMVSAAAAAYTIEYYFKIGHPEITFTIAGIIMIAASYFFMKYLKNGKNGITVEKETLDYGFLKELGVRFSESRLSDGE